jgi:hypothetical protein
MPSFQELLQKSRTYYKYKKPTSGKDWKQKLSATNLHYEKNDKFMILRGWYCKEDGSLSNLKYPGFNYEFFVKTEFTYPNNEKDQNCFEAILESHYNEKENYEDHSYPDIRMKRFYKDKKAKGETYIFYTLRVMAGEELMSLVKNLIIRDDGTLWKRLEPNLNALHDHLSPEFPNNLMLLLTIIKSYIDSGDSKQTWVKSEGELLTLLVLLVLYRTKILTNIKQLENPLTRRKLEFDFCIMLEGDNVKTLVVIEVDGEYHKGNEQKKIDIIKNKLLTNSEERSDCSYQMCRVEWKAGKGEMKFCEELYDKLTAGDPQLTETKESLLLIMKRITKSFKHKKESQLVPINDRILTESNWKPNALTAQQSIKVAIEQRANLIIREIFPNEKSQEEQQHSL